MTDDATSTYVRPIRNDLNRGFWEGLDQGRLQLQRCLACSELRYPHAHRCPSCLSDAWGWQTVSGRGEIFSHTVFHQVYHSGWKERVPYNVVLVQLDEGPRMFSNVLPLSRTDLTVGMRVRMVVDDEDGVRIPRFVVEDRRPPAGEAKGAR